MYRHSGSCSVYGINSTETKPYGEEQFTKITIIIIIMLYSIEAGRSVFHKQTVKKKGKLFILILYIIT